MSKIGDILKSTPSSSLVFKDSNGATVEMSPNYMIETHQVTAIDSESRPSLIRPIAICVDKSTSSDSINNLKPIIRLKDEFTLSTDNTISTWKNSAGINYNFGQSTAAKRPVLQSNAINGKPAVYFDGVDDVLTLPINTLVEGTFTKFFVIKLTTPNGFIFEAENSSYIWSGVNSTCEVVKSANNANGMLATGRNATAGWATDNEVKIVCVTYNGTNATHTLTVNGGNNLLTGVSNEVGSSDRTAGLVTLGARTGGDLPTKGFIGEFIQFDRALTAQEVKSVTDELSAYWLATPVSNQLPITPELYLKVDETSVTDTTGGTTTISSVLDKSGKNRHATQSNKAFQPALANSSINGLKGATFNTNPKKLTTPDFLDSSYNKSFTSFTVSKMAPQNAVSVPYSAVNSNGMYQHWTQRQSSNDNFLAWSEGLAGTDGAKTVSMYHKPKADGAAIEMFNYDGAVRTIRTGYLEQKTWAVGDLNVTGPVNFGSREGTDSYSFKGDVNALIVAKNTTKTEQDAVMNILNNEYQLYTDEDKKYFGKLVVCFDGHSIAHGWNTEGALLKNYANKVMQKLGSGTFWNTAQPGRDSVHLNAQAPARVDPIFSRKTYTENGVTKNMNNILVYYEATNSINLQNMSALDTFNNVKAYCRARKLANPDLKIILIPCGPQGPEPKSTPAEIDAENYRIASYEARRSNYNSMVLAAFNAGESWIDGYVRIDLDDRVNLWNASYYNNATGLDYIHPNTKGHELIAEALLATILPLISI